MSDTIRDTNNPDLFLPSLREAAEHAGLDLKHLTVALPCDDQKRIAISDRHRIMLHDGTNGGQWIAPPLQEMFRGNEPAPPDMERHPEAYVQLFYFIERHMITVCAALGDRTDQEFEEIYSNLRRRPDGRSLGVAHDAAWQVAALLPASCPLSLAEYEAIFGQLAKSTRRWRQGPASRNYIAYLRKTLS